MLSRSSGSMFKCGLGRFECPREAGERLAWCDTSGSEATPDEERRAVGTGGNCRSCGADSFCSPAVGETDHDEPSACCSVEETVTSGGGEDRLGDDADQLLHEERGTGE